MSAIRSWCSGLQAQENKKDDKNPLEQSGCQGWKLFVGLKKIIVHDDDIININKNDDKCTGSREDEHRGISLINPYWSKQVLNLVNQALGTVLNHRVLESLQTKCGAEESAKPRGCSM